MRYCLLALNGAYNDHTLNRCNEDHGGHVDGACIACEYTFTGGDICAIAAIPAT